MREMGSTEAKVRLPELLRTVEHGETIATTRQGRRVAHLVPTCAEDRANRERAVARFQKLRANWKPGNFSTEEVLASRHEGHRL